MAGIAAQRTHTHEEDAPNLPNLRLFPTVRDRLFHSYPELADKIVELHYKGWPISTLSERIGVSKQIIYYWKNRYKRRAVLRQKRRGENVMKAVAEDMVRALSYLESQDPPNPRS